MHSIATRHPRHDAALLRTGPIPTPTPTRNRSYASPNLSNGDPDRTLPLLAPIAVQADGRSLHAKLTGFEGVHGPSLGVGAIFSTGDSCIALRIDNKRQREIRYELSYDFPDAAAPVAGMQFVNQAHLHFGQAHTTGGIAVWLCQSAANPAPADVAEDTPHCPSPEGKVEGTIRPQQVLGLAAQGLPGGEHGLDAVVKALRDEASYANMHTDRFPPGELRGQLDD